MVLEVHSILEFLGVLVGQLVQVGLELEEVGMALGKVGVEEGKA